jgi:hypothetical protein
MRDAKVQQTYVVCLLCAVLVLAAVGAGSDGVPTGRHRR